MGTDVQVCSNILSRDLRETSREQLNHICIYNVHVRGEEEREEEGVKRRGRRGGVKRRGRRGGEREEEEGVKRRRPNTEKTEGGP